MKKIVLSVLIAMSVAAFVQAGEKGAPDVPEAPVLGEEDIPVSIARTEVGDWALYALADGSSLKLTVVERWTEHGDDHLVIESAMTPPGKGGRKKVHVEEELVSVKERVADARDLGPFDFVTEADVLVDGQKIDAVVVNYVEDGKVVRQSWFSDSVPVYGLVRGVRIDGDKRTISLNLKRFGSVGDED